MNNNFTVTFYNAAPYPIDIFWINYENREQLLKSNLTPREELTQITYFTHNWVFKRSSTNESLVAKGNGVQGERFEGCVFGAMDGEPFRVTIMSGKVIYKVKKWSRVICLSLCVFILKF